MFTIFRVEENMNIFFIVKKDILSKNGLCLKTPFTVYGFLRVEGSDYMNATVARKNISDELKTNDLIDVTELAKLAVFPVD